MWVVDTVIKRPVMATMVVMAFVVIGAISYPRIGIDLYPDIDFPIVTVSTALKGADPETVDTDVTDRIEEAVNTIGGIKTIHSTSAEGFSSVLVEFVIEKDIDVAAQEIREKISAIRAALPKDIDEPIIRRIDPAAVPVLWFTLIGEKWSIRELSAYADEVLKEEFQRIEGVGALTLAGLGLREVKVWLDADRLKAYQITVFEVLQALRRQHLEIPAGRIEGKTKEYIIKVKGEFSEIEDFNNLIVAYRDGAPVRLENIGRVEDGIEEKRSITRFNGTPAIGLAILKRSGANTVEVIGRVKRESERLKEMLPSGMTLAITFDKSDFIKGSIYAVKHQLIYAGLLAALVVFLFLRSFRVTTIVALTLPASIISTFAVMNMFGFTFNQMTMLALVLSIGILIDNAIIITENIQRHIEDGMSPRKSASFATSEIGFAALSSTLAIIAIFFPVAFMEGIIGLFFMEFGLTFVFAMLASLFFSFVLIPMLASRYLRPVDSRQPVMQTGKFSLSFDRGYEKVKVLYKRLLNLSLNHRAAVIALAAGAFISSLFISSLLGREFVPPEDHSQFIVRLEAPVGRSVDEVDRLFKPAEETVRDIPEVTTLFYAQGLGGHGFMGEVNKAMMFVRLKPKADRQRSQSEIMAAIRKQLAQVPGVESTVEDAMLIGGGLRGTPIQYSIKGMDLERIEVYSREIAARFAAICGVVDVDTSLMAGRPEVRVFVDRDKATVLGVDVAAIAETITFLMHGVDAAEFEDRATGKRYDVRARLNQADRDSPDDIKRLYVRSKEGGLVDLSSIIRIDKAGGPAAIERVDRQRVVHIFANLEGKPMGEAKAEIEAIATEVLPQGFSGKDYGMADAMEEAFKYLFLAFILGIVLVYMVLASQFESFVHPFTIFFSVPLSLIGAFSALLLTGSTINIMSLIGVILLVGIVTKNAILLIDYTNTLREKGMGRREAICEAGPIRLRPILMTSFSTILATLPVAIGIGEGAEMRAPMAIVVIGGLLSSFFLTLVVVPVVYDLFDSLQDSITKRPSSKTNA